MAIADAVMREFLRTGFALLLATAALSPLPAHAQKPLRIEPLPNDDDMVLAKRASEAHDPSEALARYLRVLAREPRDLEALTGAGRASLDVGDADAAISFYARAEEIAPRNGLIKAGLGSAMVQLVQPKAALKFFGDAVDYGVPVVDIASDRGLAYALRGDSKRARADYELAIANRPDSETIRRLALTKSVDGDQAGALATLNPLLFQRDKAAWRMRVFIMAIGGDIKGAQDTANAILPQTQAAAIAPFLDRFPKLRASQKVAAAQFGQFPSDGKQYSEAELFAAAGTPLPVTATRNLERDKKLDDEQGDGVTEADETAKADTDAKPREKPKKADTGYLKIGNADILKAKKPEVLTAKQKRDEQPDADKKPIETPKGDNDKSTKAREADKGLTGKNAKAKDDAAKKDKQAADTPKKPEKATDSAKTTGKKGNKESERYWVQVATGAYKPDLGKAWTNLKTKYPALLGRRSPWTTPLNRTNRVLIGPFKTEDEAQAFVNKAAGAGLMTSRFKSLAGQTIEALKP